nr:MAG TPA: hypothetical protein [Caudoviricetes sp.]
MQVLPSRAIIFYVIFIENYNFLLYNQHNTALQKVYQIA